MPAIKATLIISVYNDIRFLKTVLDSVSEQTFMDFEIIISEDSIHEDMKAFVENYNFKNPYQHLVQEDLGWRKNRALNRAILAAKSDYLVFIDGDCVLHPRFMEQHIKNARENRILGGKRIKLNEELTQRQINKSISPDVIERYLILNIFHLKKKGILFPEEGICVNRHTILGFIALKRKLTTLTGCNMSFPKKAILSINGFDEDYILPAIGEDIDLTWRFREAGFILYSVRNFAVQYHLNHIENWIDQRLNNQLIQDKMEKGNFRCINGIEKL